MITLYADFDFNPRSPCGERQRVSRADQDAFLFQSTLPVRGATEIRDTLYPVSAFQSTLPVRGATDKSLVGIEGTEFQSTLPVRGATWPSGRSSRRPRYFNPRSPCGERLLSTTLYRSARAFQSTLPVRGATTPPACTNVNPGRFQSTLPVRGATAIDCSIS